METKQADRIADALEEMVFTGQFEQGERLDETNLAKRFGVSRTPVREALQRLVITKLAEQRPRRGVFVQQPGSIAVIEMFETMAEIEGVCGRLASQRLTPGALTQLHAFNQLCREAATAADCDSYSRHNERFHHEIYDMSGNAYLAGQARLLYKRLRPFRRVQFHMTERMLQSIAEHDAILDAFSRGAAEDAGNLLRSHVADQGERFHQQMARLRRSAANRNG